MNVLPCDFQTVIAYAGKNNFMISFNGIVISSSSSVITASISLNDFTLKVSLLAILYFLQLTLLIKGRSF